MSSASILGIAALAVAATVFPVHAADMRYPIANVVKIEITEPSIRSAWENKNFLDCDDVVLTEEDVRYALRHMRKVPEKSYFDEYAERTGCLGGARVTFKNGKTIAIGIEPTGRINTFELNAKLKPTSGPETYYECQPCKARKMGLLKDALDRADERRLRKLEAEGKIPPGEAERRLKTLRASR
ncbi:hypothetical protein ACSFBF_05185 [Variovorax sp. ZT5P49]|uniref:hypothetical protein n=1 Tax=Variovorax sp. ZT5P49 TaxID=3443733 RepID=UPI003F45F7A0